MRKAISADGNSPYPRLSRESEPSEEFPMKCHCAGQQKSKALGMGRKLRNSLLLGFLQERTHCFLKCLTGKDYSIWHAKSQNWFLRK
jgi:hypothetical protein